MAKREEEMNAQKLIDVVAEEMERKYNPEQLCELILKKNPELKNYLNEKNKNNGA